MSSNLNNQALLQILNASSPTTIAEVITTMEAIDNLLPNHDGLKWFNLLYKMVTVAVVTNPPPQGWNDPQWISRLDVIFARLYFDAISSSIQNSTGTPRAWQALFEARFNAGIDRVQFALCGMNAHINHDLPLALVQLSTELQMAPDDNSPQHADFQSVNNILDMVEPEAMQILATGIVGQVAQHLGRLDDVLAMWKVRKARDTSWTNGEILWQIRSVQLLRNKFLRTLDRLTGFAGRGLLISIDH